MKQIASLATMPAILAFTVPRDDCSAIPRSCFRRRVGGSFTVADEHFHEASFNSVDVYTAND